MAHTYVLWRCGASTGSISYPELRATDTRLSGERALARFGVLKCVSCHFCPPSGSAAFLSEIANRRVKMGLTLERECEDQLFVEKDRRVG